MKNSDRHLSHYELTRLINEGGFAYIYEARDLYLERYVAIKVPKYQTQHSHTAFLREARLLASMEHPHIIEVMDLNMHKSIPFFVMPYALNGSLRQRYPSGKRVAFDIIVDYVWQITDALSYLHDQGIVHQDIKPENLLLDAQNQIQIADFGTATQWSQGQSRKKERLIGTLTYIAPERLSSKARPASDQYSLAVVVYEWATGENLFSGPTGEILRQHLHSPVPTQRMDELGISPAIQRVLVKALAKRPEERFKTVYDFALAPDYARTDTLLSSLTRWINRLLCSQC